VLDPADLLAVARHLADPGAALPLSDARLRRAVSTAYYAVFHKVLRAASQRFMGPDQEHSAGYVLLYRGFDHKHMKTVCEALQVSTLKDKYKHHLRKSAVSQDMRDFAGIFPAPRDLRHRADYDPAAEFQPSDVLSIVDSAAVAMDAFDRVAPDEQADVLTLLLVGARS
jgi:uncharacterized protein (UPF0332 family)